jgi:uncharacterized protein
VATHSTDTTPPAVTGRLPFRLPLLLLAGFIFLVLPTLVTFYTDWLWFGELGYQAVFRRGIETRALLGVVLFAATFGLLFWNLRHAVDLLPQPYLILGQMADGSPVVLDRRQLRQAALAVAGVVAVFVGLFGSTQWLLLLQFLHATPFGEADPILGRDAAFYVFRLPFFEFLRGLTMVLLVLTLAAVAAVYVLTGVVSFDPRAGISIGRRARRHLSVLAAGLFLLLAFGAWLDVPRLLVTPGGVVDGATYVDVHARLPVLRLQLGAALLAAALALYHGFAASHWPILVAGGSYLLVSLGGGAYAAGLHRLRVAPNEQVMEAPYIRHNIEATRRAFALDNVEERELSGDALLSRADIENNVETIRNVRLWDHVPLLATFGQIQEIRTYYNFVSVTNDRYVIDGEYRQTMLSARELNWDALPNRTWPNERLTFTHGYGGTRGPVNQVTQEGLPVLFIRDLPPVSTADLEVAQPAIYYGELSSDHVFVGTRTEEFHYPRGEDNVFTRYDGEGGVAIDGLWRRLLFSIRFRSVNTLISEQLGSASRVLFRRRIQERVAAIAPFLRYDRDPYLVISEGRLFWIQDAYTTTDLYPYSSRGARGINYIRNSVKVVIDAYHGTTTFYTAEPDDPLVRTLAAIFPTLFRPLDEMPADLRSHVRYPEEIFSLQASMYMTYHMTNPAIFYNKEDQWEVPAIDVDGRPAAMQPYYTIMRLHGELSAEFIQMLPFTPRLKDNLAAWMVARSDGEHYGRLLVFRFPKQKVIFGPRQIVSRINQDQAISPQITLWNQQGSQVIQGTLLVIPIEESLLYIRPLYLRAAGGRIPELKRVIVAYQNQIVMEETLEGALDRLFGPVAGVAPRMAEAPVATAEPAATGRAGPPLDVGLAAQAREHYQRALQAQRDGNWALYGQEIGRLGEVLERLAAPPQP